jgi:glutaredoxin 3
MNDSSKLPEKIGASGGCHAKVEIYSSLACGYCVRAKHILRDKGVAFIEYRMDGNEQARLQMIERTGGRSSLPQIFINNQAIGGFSELHQLDKSGRLDALLKGETVIDDPAIRDVL